MKENKTQIFIFDLIFSLIIIMVSLGIVTTYFVNTSYNRDIYDLSNQLLNGFTQTKINTLNSDEIRDMFINNQIKNVDNTVAQQVAEFYYLGNPDLAKNLTRIFIKDYVLTQLSLNLTFSNEIEEIELFSQINFDQNLENSEITSYSSRKIFGFLNVTDYYGPYEFRVRIWV